ncbi:hypothetical protein Hanom_Chr01g00020771 [Helianthus anomalus]
MQQTLSLSFFFICRHHTLHLPHSLHSNIKHRELFSFPFTSFPCKSKIFIHKTPSSSLLHFLLQKRETLIILSTPTDNPLHLPLVLSPPGTN